MQPSWSSFLASLFRVQGSAKSVLRCLGSVLFFRFGSVVFPALAAYVAFDALDVFPSFSCVFGAWRLRVLGDACLLDVLRVRLEG